MIVIISPPKPLQLVKNAKKILSASKKPDYLFVMWMEKILALDENGIIAGMCFLFLTNLFTELSVHTCTVFHSPETHITNGFLK